MSSLVHCHLVSFMVLKTNGFAEASLICSLMRKALPYCKAISAQDVYNVRVSAIILMKNIETEGKTLDSFELKPDVQKQLFTPLDNISDDFLDDAAKSAKEIFYDFLRLITGSF